MRGWAAFPFVREFLRTKVRGERVGPVFQILWRLLMAGLGTVVVIGLASLGFWVATAPEWISLTLEPLSLLLLPGLPVALALAGSHDLDPRVVVQSSIVFYMAFFYWLLSWRGRRRRR